MIQPMRGYVLIEIIEDEGKSSSGLVIPDQAQERQAKGKVIQVGELPLDYLKYIEEKEVDYLKYFKEIAKDDIVWFKRFAGEKVKDEGKEYLLTPYKEILGKII